LIPCATCATLDDYSSTGHSETALESTIGSSRVTHCAMPQGPCSPFLVIFLSFYDLIRFTRLALVTFLLNAPSLRRVTQKKVAFAARGRGHCLWPLSSQCAFTVPF